MKLFSRRLEAGLLVLAALVLMIAIVALELSQGNQIGSDIFALVGGFFLVFLIAHTVMCWIAPNSDQIMLPIAALLNGVGLVMIYRLDLASDRSLAKSQVMWTVIGVAMMCAVLVFLRDHRRLQNYSYLMGLAGLILLALPTVWPTSLNADASVWISIGPFSIQPGEFSKILLLLFFATLLVNKRRLFNVAGRSFLGLQFPRLRDLSPLLLVWGIALVIMAAMNDFGPALLLFGTVLGMLYIATNRASWLVLGLGLAAIGAVAVYQVSAKIQDRVANFVDPIGNYDDKGFQLAQALFGMSFGGVTGTGLGSGYPFQVPVAHSDFILAAIGEELGLIGLAAVLILYAFFVSRGFTSAMLVKDSYGKLVAAGLSLTIAVQVFVVTGGISRLLPMTGLTTPFLAHGGSSLLANYILLAIILRISDAAYSPEPAPAYAAGAARDGYAPAELEPNDGATNHQPVVGAGRQEELPNQAKWNGGYQP
ncbi:FtsW/RodA/SpoVE family cell cycle protein [Corynebacterium auriscanis]|uniref:Cell division protein FtsW n=1 Tax=Corynebacterium auriscanis TaxID=99807 RepID=A0A0A2DNV0_9CORY|nr:FtsW/RodA/SpoVE family cell cycle protein [Corynebacterium auriscanis]KGM18556.1 cell division protein FtsW [Corynebacterium auriscanis]WJY71715.1 Lipid II flippase FtsW [Corynebacterium auriscanis]